MMSFRVWLRHFIKDDTAIGDLSRDVDNDSNFPTKNDYNLILTHLQNLNACDGAIDTFKVSWSDYLRSLSASDFIRFKSNKSSGYDVL